MRHVQPHVGPRLACLAVQPLLAKASNLAKQLLMLGIPHEAGCFQDSVDRRLEVGAYLSEGSLGLVSFLFKVLKSLDELVGLVVHGHDDALADAPLLELQEENIISCYDPQPIYFLAKADTLRRELPLDV